MLQVFPLMLRVFRVMLHVFHVMLQVSCNVARVSCNVAGVSCNVSGVSCNVARVSRTLLLQDVRSLSVTRYYCVKTAKLIIKLFSAVESDDVSCNVARVSCNVARVSCNCNGTSVVKLGHRNRKACRRPDAADSVPSSPRLRQ